jgi:hypothetical protein
MSKKFFVPLIFFVVFAFWYFSRLISVSDSVVPSHPEIDYLLRLEEQRKQKESSRESSSSSSTTAPPTTSIIPHQTTFPQQTTTATTKTKTNFHKSWLDDPLQTTETNLSHRVLQLPMTIALRQFNALEWHTMMAMESSSSQKQPQGSSGEIVCSLMITATQNCNPLQHSLVECVDLIGKENFEMILGERCLNSDFWKNQLPRFLEQKYSSSKDSSSSPSSSSSTTSWKKLRRGVIIESTTIKKSDAANAFPFVPPSQRHPSQFPPPRICTSPQSNGCKHFPFGFAIPRTAYERGDNNENDGGGRGGVTRAKSFAWMPISPGGKRGYSVSIHEEDLFHELFKRSLFAWSHRRSGWECMRFHEEISAGALPFFYDLEKCPKNTLGHYPKELLLEARKLAGVSHILQNPDKFTEPHPTERRIRNFIRNGEIERSSSSNDASLDSSSRLIPIFNMTRYFELADAIFAFAKKYMTTRSLVAYLLKSMEAEHARNVVFFSRNRNDYTENSVLHGLGDLGINVTIVSSQQNYDFYYMTETDDGTFPRKSRDAWLKKYQGSTYGAAFGFSGKYMASRLHRPWRDLVAAGGGGKRSTSSSLSEQLMKEIQEKKYDAGIWQLTGQYEEFVKPMLEAGGKIGFLQFRDWHDDPRKGGTMDVCRKFGGPVFVREMSDEEDC